MSSAPAAAEIANDARWLAQAVDVASGLVRLVAMSRDDYRAASFLDDRLLQQPRNTVTIRWAEATAALGADARRDARWIFHIGHVGSTLVSRLLGELPDVLAIREPRLLRDLTLAPRPQRDPFLGPTARLMSRTFAASERALIKATSMASEIAPGLVPSGERALFLYASPRAYTATILAGENSLKELEMLFPHRAERMAPRVVTLADAGNSHAHAAAAAWACEMTALEAAAEAMDDRHLLWADFDALLSRLECWLSDAAQFFGFHGPADRLREIAAGPLVFRYSKALEYDYSPNLRQELLEEAARENRAQIESAMTMLQAAARQSPLLARALARSQAEG